MLRRTPRARPTELAFDAIATKGSLLGVDWLARVARLAAPHQAPADYGVRKGIELREEIALAWRSAQAHWIDYESGRKAKADPEALARRFVVALLREAFGYTDLVECHEPVALDGRAWPLTALGGGTVPVVCAAAAEGLDGAQRAFADGGRKRSAFGVLQEFLNASKDCLWGLCADGAKLRLVRDNESLLREAYLEVDLAAIFTGGLYADFAAAWLLVHRSRLRANDHDPANCPLEVWRLAALAEGTTARDRLRVGFEKALRELGNAFLVHPANTALRAALHHGSLTKENYFGELLRLVYRVIFLLAIEERELLHPKGTPREVEARYAEGYGVRRLRDRAARRAAHDRHGDLWEALTIVFRGLAGGNVGLGLPALGGLFAPTQCPHLDAATIENHALLRALFELCWLREAHSIARVNWKDMGADELGYIYEGLLELSPQITKDGREFGFAEADENRGNARKLSGSYYTPESLVHVLLERALDPVIEATLARSPTNPAKALLELTIVDPACGSGHFLLSAARRLAEHVARASADGAPATEAARRRALRQVIARCIFGVDLNPMAVELCKVSLWLEAVDPGAPLTFLDSHLQHGNALLGATPALMADGIPDAAWDPIEGDDKKTASALKKRNKAEAKQITFGFGTATVDEVKAVARAVSELDETSDADLSAVATKEARWSGILGSEAFRHQKLVADAWCAAFVWPKHAGADVDAAPTHDVWRKLRDAAAAPPATVATVTALARQYHFFHWHLQFPQVFAKGGFDVVLGNPPWERVKLQEQEFFASRDEEIANAPNAAARKRLIAQLSVTNPQLWDEWTAASRKAEGESHSLRQSGRYPLCGKGDVNTYAIFAEHNRSVLGPNGRAGFIVPTGIATDDTTKEYFGDLVNKQELSSFYSFENEEFVFPGVHHAFRFALMSVARGRASDAADLVFFARQVAALDDRERHFTLSPADFAALNPNTRTCPTFRSRRDAELNLAMYRRVGVLWREDAPDGNPWGLRFMAMLHMANDSGLFRTRAELDAAAWKLTGNHFVLGAQRALPLVEAKMVHHYDHRYGTYEGQTDAQANQGKLPEFDDIAHADPKRLTLPKYWIAEGDVEERLEADAARWLLGWRRICRSSDQRTFIASLMPFAGVGDSEFLLLTQRSPRDVAALYANLCSFCFDYTARQKVGGTNASFHIVRQLPVLPPTVYTGDTPWSRGTALRDWILPRVVELTYTAWDLEPFARDVGDEDAPFVWDRERRVVLRCELDAAFFHLYGVSRDDAGYILDSFPVVRKNEEKAHGEYRTRRVVLECYDALAAATAKGTPYVSPLGPPRRAS